MNVESCLEEVFLNYRNHDMVWDVMIFSCRFFAPPPKNEKNMISQKDLSYWTTDALLTLCPPLPVKALQCCHDDYVKINDFLAIPTVLLKERVKLSDKDVVKKVLSQVNFLYFFIPLLLHMLLNDHTTAKAVLRLSLDSLRRRDDHRSQTVYKITSLIFDSFVNVWHFSYVEQVDSLRTHQWKKLPKAYDFCQKDFFAIQASHTTTKGQRRLADSSFAKLYGNYTQENTSLTQNIAICIRELNKFFNGNDKTQLIDPAFSLGLWVYGLTCSKQSQKWLSANSWKNIPSAYAENCVFINPLMVVAPSSQRSSYASDIIKPYLSLYNTLLSSPEHMDVPFENWFNLYSNIRDTRRVQFFKNTVPHLQHVVTKIILRHDVITSGVNVDPDVLHTLCAAFERLHFSFQKCKRCLLSHANVAIVSRDELLLELVGQCSYEKFAAVQACDSEWVCVKMSEKNKTKSFMYLDIKHTIRIIWPSYAKDVDKNVILLEETQADVALVLMSKDLFELLENLYLLEISPTTELKQKIINNSLCGEEIITELKKVSTKNGNISSPQKTRMFVFQRNPFTYNFDLADKTHSLWSPDFMFLQSVVAYMYDVLLYKQENQKK